MSYNQYSYDKEQQKEYILSEENTGHSVFESFLETLPKNTIELNVPELKGTVDLGILSSKGFEQIKHIYFFHPGQITAIYNIPPQVSTLHCSHNLLTELPDLPESLQVLNVSNNMLTSINVYPCTQLHSLNISYNRIQSISGLPSSLQTFHCEHNRITLLNLASTTKLVSLRCNDNPDLILEKIPSTIVDVVYPTTIQQQHYLSTDTPSVEYMEELNKYLQLKSDYTIKLKEMRTKKHSMLPKCMGCKKNVGMIFSSKNSKYAVHCGDSPPCPWNMVLHRGFYNPVEEVIGTYSSIVDEIKQSIIQHKMDVLFHYLNEKEVMKIHEDEKQAYQTANQYLEKKKKEFENFFYSAEKQNEIEKLQYTMNQELEYVKEALQEERIQDAVDIQATRIFPLSQKIQKLQYEVMEVMYASDDEDGPIRIVQEPVHFTKLEVNLKEQPTIE